MYLIVENVAEFKGGRLVIFNYKGGRSVHNLGGRLDICGNNKSNVIYLSFSITANV
jgi:hypothetical protein